MQNFLSSLNNSLFNLYPESEIKYFGRMLLEKITGFSRTEILAGKDYTLTEEQRRKGQEYIEQLTRFEPIQYILGETEFYGLKFNVNPSVLIPRPETEELVEWIINDLQFSNSCTHKPEILDIGTGSGCIAIALKKKLVYAEVSALDISDDALAVAAENAEMNRVEVEFLKDNILNPVVNDRKWNVIVSNPPYIPVNKKAEMADNVVNFEPHLALFVPDEDPLLFYRAIAGYAKQHLAVDGKLYFEIHIDQAENCRKLLESIGFNDITVRKDLSGNDRMICAKI